MPTRTSHAQTALLCCRSHVVDQTVEAQLGTAPRAASQPGDAHRHEQHVRTSHRHPTSMQAASSETRLSCNPWPACTRCLIDPREVPTADGAAAQQTERSPDDARARAPTRRRAAALADAPWSRASRARTATRHTAKTAARQHDARRRRGRVVVDAPSLHACRVHHRQTRGNGGREPAGWQWAVHQRRALLGPSRHI